MKSEPNREEALFQAAALLSGPERAIFLNGACHGDPALRQRLKALLAAHEQSDLATQAQTIPVHSEASSSAKTSEDKSARPTRPVAEFDPADPADEAVGQTLGRYKLLEKIGEGGCGVVYMAEQNEPVRRRVALKIIKLGMDTKQVIARFEAERQALALMDHPNIAKVLDAGRDANTGPPLLRHGAGAGHPNHRLLRPEPVLPPTERLDLFIQVCQAIQHAHQKGIIHRDIKPSNILVTLHDGVPVPKVIDFGIAKATEGRLTDKTVLHRNSTSSSARRPT